MGHDLLYIYMYIPMYVGINMKAAIMKTPGK